MNGDHEYFWHRLVVDVVYGDDGAFYDHTPY
jgi:hypothetical protein